jgi:hypothetical protein
MTIRYIFTKRDLVVAQIHTLLRNRIILSFWGILIAFICYGQLHDPTNVLLGLGDKICLSVFTALLLLALLLGFTLVLNSTLVLLRKNKGLLGEHKITITGDGLAESTDCNESLHKWPAYHKTVSTHSYLFLYPTDAMYFCIPKRRPLLEGDIKEFERALREKVKNA